MFGFRSFVLGGGVGSTAAAVTLDTVSDESRMMVDGVARSPSRLCSRDGKTCCNWDALSTIFLLALVPYWYFLLFFFLLSFFLFFLHPGMFIFFVSLRLCSSHLLLSACTYLIVPVVSACVICTLPHLGIISFFIRLVFFFVVLISRVAFFCCALVPGTLSTWFGYLDSLATFGFSLSHCDHRICVSLGWRIRKDTGSTANVVG